MIIYFHLGELRGIIQNLDAILRHHVQSASLDDVHLLPHVALPADIVARGEHLQLQLHHQRLQQAGLTVLQSGDFISLHNISNL